MRKLTLIGVILSVAVLSVVTHCSIKPLPDDLSRHIGTVERNSYVDRFGKRLNITYANEWNLFDAAATQDISPVLQRAFVLSEDKRFFEHGGIDWLARLNALGQNLRAGSVVRGASTISEQVARMINPRPRTLWSRWLEGFEAIALEQRHSKLDILEFYLNQVPYKANRRGIVQAAHYYFDRDLDTLNEKEILALAVLVRSPRWLDPTHEMRRLDRSIEDLARRLNKENAIHMWHEKTMAQKIEVTRIDKAFNVQHFIAYANDNTGAVRQRGHAIHTTIDLELQLKVQKIIDNRLHRLQRRQVGNGAALVIDHRTNEILSWVVGHAGQHDKAFNAFDAVRTKRQPGSALKPLLYSSALLHGWTAATMLDDSPLEESVGLGMHTYHNYSRAHYGRISLREALGNSLNIPAVKVVQFVGPENFLDLLYKLGIKSLSNHPNVYGDGLALGNGELTLYELVAAYTALARMGDYKPLSFLAGEESRGRGKRVISEDVASLIADILSDPSAREREFGRDSILNFPQQTAVKTGTSSDYRDAWALGFNDRYTVGVWVGNMDYSPMDEVTGANGPALALRAIFNELNRNRVAKPLNLSRNLLKHRVCIATGLAADEVCEARDEWFVAGTGPSESPEPATEIRLRKPSKGLSMAMDPRIPDDHEYFEFALSDSKPIRLVNWFVNNDLVATTQGPTYPWKLARGEFSAYAQVWLRESDNPVTTAVVGYGVH